MSLKRIILPAMLIVGAISQSTAAAAAAPTAYQTAFTLTSTAFAQGGIIPKVHECTSSGTNDPRQRNESPPLAWAGAPATARSFAIVMRDIDNFNLIHWVIYDIPVTTASLPQNVQHVYRPAVPAGSRQVYYRGSANLFGYQGPCSPRTINTYEFVVYALNRPMLTTLNSSSSTQAAVRAITGAAIGSARLTGES